MIHGARSNTNVRRRTGYTMRYSDRNMKLNLNLPGSQGHKLRRCRGKNPHGNPVVS
jgi:ectoine hydroxylase-related dioxygenase (phytanoyl-CoA dioxygenase family)